MTLADSRYLLLELPIAVSAGLHCTHPTSTSTRRVPIIARAEHNRGIAENPERLRQLIRHGALQVTAGSLSVNSEKCKSCVQANKNLIHTYGSDHPQFKYEIL